MRRKIILIFTLSITSLLTLSAAPAPAGMGENQKVLHLLNRLGFGPRPGDIERVREMGIDKYIDQQLHPERIENTAAEARLDAFPSIAMDAGEIARRYPRPTRHQPC